MPPRRRTDKRRRAVLTDAQAWELQGHLDPAEAASVLAEADARPNDPDLQAAAAILRGEGVVVSRPRAGYSSSSVGTVSGSPISSLGRSSVPHTPRPRSSARSSALANGSPASRRCCAASGEDAPCS
jgi:hypothetical protein